MQYLTAAGFATALTVALSGVANAAGELTLYCSPPPNWCNLMVAAFEKETGIPSAVASYHR